MTKIIWNTPIVGEELVINQISSNESSKEIQILMPKGSAMKEHKAPFAISVQVLSGSIDFQVKGQNIELNTLDMICLEASVEHALFAKESSIVRLSLSKHDGVERVKSVNS